MFIAYFEKMDMGTGHPKLSEGLKIAVGSVQVDSGLMEHEGLGSCSYPPPPHFFGNYKQLLKKGVLSPPP